MPVYSERCALGVWKLEARLQKLQAALIAVLRVAIVFMMFEFFFG